MERKPDTSRNIPRNISFFPLHFVLYLGKFIFFEILHTLVSMCLLATMESMKGYWQYEIYIYYIPW